jgi:virulence-associated protein VapD
MQLEKKQKKQYKQSFNYLTLHGTDFSNLKGCIFLYNRKANQMDNIPYVD